MSYIFLFLFWFGFFVLFYKNNGSLKNRAQRLALGAKATAEEIAKRSMLHGFINKFKSDRRLRMQNKELAECLSYIKNIAVLGNSRGVSVQYLIEELADYSSLLRPAFIKMARFLNVNDKQSARSCLSDLVGTTLALDVGTFLAGWDDIPPEDVLDMIDAYQTILREERATELQRRDEMISDIVYFPVVINCMVVLVNFIYTAYFLEQQDALSLLF